MAVTPQLLFRNMTWAARAQTLLARYGVSSNIIKVTNSGGLNGCGFALEVQGDMHRVTDILRQANIQVVSILY